MDVDDEFAMPVAFSGNPGNTRVGYTVCETGALTDMSTSVINENNASVEPPVIGAHWACVGVEMS